MEDLQVHERLTSVREALSKVHERLTSVHEVLTKVHERLSKVQMVRTQVRERLTSVHEALSKVHEWLAKAVWRWVEGAGCQKVQVDARLQLPARIFRFLRNCKMPVEMNTKPTTLGAGV